MRLHHSRWSNFSAFSTSPKSRGAHCTASWHWTAFALVKLSDCNGLMLILNSAYCTSAVRLGTEESRLPRVKPAKPSCRFLIPLEERLGQFDSGARIAPRVYYAFSLPLAAWLRTFVFSHRSGDSLVARRAHPCGGPVDRPTDHRGAYRAPLASPHSAQTRICYSFSHGGKFIRRSSA